MKKILIFVSLFFPLGVFACGPTITPMSIFKAIVTMVVFVLGYIIVMIGVYHSPLKKLIITKWLRVIIAIILGFIIAFAINVLYESVRSKIADKKEIEQLEQRLESGDCEYVKDIAEVKREESQTSDKFSLDSIGGYTKFQKFKNIQAKGVKSGWYCAPKWFKDEATEDWIQTPYKEPIYLGC